MSGHGSSCGACKFLRRKCSSACVFAPFFSHEQSAAEFAAVHKIFGASNASKLLSCLPMQSRGEAAFSICYEAQARVRDPIYGCVAHIFALQQQVASLQDEIESLAAQLLPLGSNSTSGVYNRNLDNMNTEFLFHQLPVQHQAFDQQVPDYSITCTLNINNEQIFSGGSEQELLPMRDELSFNTWDPSCFTGLSGDQFTDKPSYQLEKLGAGTVAQETMWTANSLCFDSFNYMDQY